MDEKIKAYFNKYKIEYEEHAHKAIFTVAESKDLKKLIPGLHCKCLFLKSDDGKFYLVGMPAEKRLNISSLRKLLKLKKLYFASEKELFDNLKIKPGSVSIFGLVNNLERDVTLIIDKEVWSADSVGFHPNVNTATLVLKHDDLERFYNSLIHNKIVLGL